MADENENSGGDGPRIRALDDQTIQRIAAGEVIERPASVVKELVENSLDADASRVRVAVENGGKDGIRVADDGTGMTAEELELAVRKHTTSKISDIEDVAAGVGTLGFRGEALHAIGAVSRLTVESKPQGETGAGTEITVEGGEVQTVEPTGCPEGTVVEVSDLFFNTPARRKFLKTDATEFDHVNTLVTQYALANPDVAFALEHNGREVFATEGQGSLRSAVLSVYGREVAESMIALDFEPDDAPVESVTGLVSHPETTRSNRSYLSTFVNDRYVTASVLRDATLAAYGNQLSAERYPFAVLFVDLPPDSVDVNVHPRKLEVRFDDEASVRQAVRDAVESALLEHGVVRSSAPRGRSAPTETEVRPESPTDEDRIDEGAGGGADTADAADTGAEAVDETSGASASAGEDAGRGGAESDERPVDPVTADAGSDETDVDAGEDRDDDGDPWVVEGLRSGLSPSQVGRTGDEAGADDGGGGDAGVGVGGDRDGTDDLVDGEPGGFPRVEPPTTQRTLDGDSVSIAPDFDRLPSMRVLGQVFDTYFVAETGDGLVLVDQHAADERINYERLKEAFAGDVASQALADPVELELTAREAALFEEYDDALASLGFDAERQDERTVAVRSVPAVIGETLDPSLLRDVLTAFVAAGDPEGRETVDAAADSLLADLACYPSITGNTSLHEGSIRGLLERLDECENPYACPHGRPVIIEFDRDEIEDRFERDYPGHAGQRREE